MIRETLVLAALAITQPTVVNGDTVKVAGIRIRLTNYDSPELFSPKCPRERELAWRAKQELELISQVKADPNTLRHEKLGTTLRRGLNQRKAAG